MIMLGVDSSNLVSMKYFDAQIRVVTGRLSKSIYLPWTFHDELFLMIVKEYNYFVIIALF